jgi:Uma2 family endonuclease
MSMTREEFWDHDEWVPGYRYELVHGVLVVNPPPDIGERKPVDELGHWLLMYKENHPQGVALDETVIEHTIATSAGFRRADRVIWCGLGRLPNPDADVPAIVIEFVSRRSRDRQRDYIEKRDEYRAIGIREYWVIDRFRRCLTVCTATEERTLDANGIHSTPLLPGFELSVPRVLAIADRYTLPRSAPRTRRRKQSDD